MSIRVCVILFAVLIGLASAANLKGEARCGFPTTRPCGSYFDENDLYGTLVCSHKADGTMLIAPQRPNDYFYCMGGFTYLKSCGSNQHFNPYINACE